MKLKLRGRLLLAISGGLYLVCLWCNTFCVQGNTRCEAGGLDLIGGIFGLFFVTQTPSNLAWLANPMIFCAWIAGALRLRVAGAVLGLSALLFAVTFRLAEKVTIGAFKEGVPVGLPTAITDYRFGYWLWVASMAAFCVWALARIFYRGSLKEASPQGQAGAGQVGRPVSG